MIYLHEHIPTYVEESINPELLTFTQVEELVIFSSTALEWQYEQSFLLPVSQSCGFFSWGTIICVFVSVTIIYKSSLPRWETDLEGSFRGLKPAEVNDLQLDINDRPVVAFHSFAPAWRLFRNSMTVIKYSLIQIPHVCVPFLFYGKIDKIMT